MIALESAIVKTITSKLLLTLIDILCTSSSPVRHAPTHPTSSSYVILYVIPYVIILPKSNLCIQGRDENLITIGNKPVFPQSLILTSD
jgi:hypothetical protein